MGVPCSGEPLRANPRCPVPVRADAPAADLLEAKAKLSQDVSDRLRLSLLEALRRVSERVTWTRLTQPDVSHPLACPRDGGLVRAEGALPTLPAERRGWDGGWL